VSHDPDEISRTFKKHCSKCATWNQVTVHRVPTDGDWGEAKPIPISVLTAVINSALNAASVFPSRRIEISDSHTDLNRSANINIQVMDATLQDFEVSAVRALHVKVGKLVRRARQPMTNQPFTAVLLHLRILIALLGFMVGIMGAFAWEYL
jgi:hypothetical protein